MATHHITYNGILYSLGILMFLVLGGSATASGQVYKYVENGVVHYTNRIPDSGTYEIVKSSTNSGSLQPLSQPQTRRVISNSSGSTTLSGNLPYLDIIYSVAETYGIPPDLLKAIIKVESNYNDRAVSPKGAKGLMQLMPATAERFGVSDIFDPEENITGGVKYLRFLFNEFGEDNLDLVLAGYNAGENAVRNYGNAIPPYRETQQYVKKIKQLFTSSSPPSYPSMTVTGKKRIYSYVDENGVLTFTNVPRVN